MSVRRFLIDLWWWRRVTRTGRRLDGVRVLERGADSLVHREVVMPIWWRLDRWWLWIWADDSTEFSTVTTGGWWAYVRVRTRRIPAPKPIGVVVGGKRIVPGDPSKVLERARQGVEDPRLRSVPDDVLERAGATFREPGGMS